MKNEHLLHDCDNCFFCCGHGNSPNLSIILWEKMKFKVITYRSEKDFLFGSFYYVHNGRGGIIYGKLKKNGNVSKYQKIYRVTE